MLQQLIGQVGQFGPLALFQSDIGIKEVVFSPVDQIGEPVALSVQVGVSI